VLPAVQYFNDLTVTHTDEEYMAKHNDVDGRAIYFISALKDQPEILEMGFELTAYQPRLQPRRASGGSRIYQTIYLDQRKEDLWTIGDLKPESIIDRAWWSAFSHTYKHFRRVVPWVWTLQGHKRTWFAGSWTLFNTHDIAISSGLAAAHRLGAPYPFEHNQLATATFDTVLGASHLRMRSWRAFRSALCALCGCGPKGSPEAPTIPFPKDADTGATDPADKLTQEKKAPAGVPLLPKGGNQEKLAVGTDGTEGAKEHLEVEPTPSSTEVRVALRPPHSV